MPEGGLIVYSAHGVAPEVRRNAERLNLRSLDATCPLVTKVHLEARDYAKLGYSIVLVGHADHQEVVGTTGEAPDAITLVESVADVEALDLPDPDRVAYITQTTLAVSETTEIVDALRRRYPNLRGPRGEDICYATTNRQQATQVLAERADLVLVVGSPHSSNSVRMVEVARAAGAPAGGADRRCVRARSGVARWCRRRRVDLGGERPGGAGRGGHRPSAGHGARRGRRGSGPHSRGHALRAATSATQPAGRRGLVGDPGPERSVGPRRPGARAEVGPGRSQGRVRTLSASGTHEAEISLMSSASFSRALGCALEGVSHASLAKRIGVSPQLLSDWKRGHRTPSPASLFRLERVLGAPAGQLSRHLGYVPVGAADAVLDDVVDRVRARVVELAEAAQQQGVPELAELRGDRKGLIDRAAEEGLASELLRLAVEDFEREHGAFTDAELQEARHRLERTSDVSSGSRAS